MNLLYNTLNIKYLVICFFSTSTCLYRFQSIRCATAKAELTIKQNWFSKLSFAALISFIMMREVPHLSPSLQLKTQSRGSQSDATSEFPRFGFLSLCMCCHSLYIVQTEWPKLTGIKGKSVLRVHVHIRTASTLLGADCDPETSTFQSVAEKKGESFEQVQGLLCKSRRTLVPLHFLPCTVKQRP